MATSDYKNALTNMRNFILGGGYVAGTMSGKDVDPKTTEVTAPTTETKQTPIKRKVSPDEIAAGFTGDIPLTPLDTTEKPASVPSSGIQRKVSPDEIAAGFMKDKNIRLEDEGSKVTGPETVVDYNQPTFGGGEGQLAPTRRTYSGGEGTKELTQSFMRPMGTGLETGDPQPDTMNTADGFVQSSVKMDEEYLNNLYASYEKQVKEGNVEGLTAISKGGGIFAAAPVNVKMEFSKLVQNDLAEIAAGNTYTNLKPDQKVIKETSLEKNKATVFEKFMEMIKAPFQAVNQFDKIDREDNEVIQPVSETDTSVDPYKYNDIKNTYDQFMELGATSGFGDVKRKQVATTAQGAALTDPDYQIPVGMKLLPHKNLNVPHFIELLYRLGKKENVNQEIYKVTL